MLARVHLPGMSLATQVETIEVPAFDLSKLELPRFQVPKLELPPFALPRLFAPKPRFSRRAMAVAGLLFAAGAGVLVAGLAVVQRHLVPPVVLRLVSDVRSRIRPHRALAVVPARAMTTVPAAAPDPDALFVESGEPC